MIEIEKRYHVNPDNIPKDKIKSKMNIQQVYANLNPDVRIRKINQDNQNTYFHTVKYFLTDNQREEIERLITEDQYDRIFSYIGKKPLNKDRYLIDLDNNLVAEVDHFETGETIVEVEFPNLETMNLFKIPNWFGEEIKDKQSFSAKIFSRINSKNIYEVIKSNS